MRGEHDFDKEISFDLEECTRALSYVNSLDATMRFKREKNTVWADVNHPNYKRLFNSGTTGHFIWNAVSIYRMIERVINIKKETVSSDEMSILVNGDDLVAAIVFQVSCKEKISKTEINYDDLISSCNIEQITNIVIDLLIENVKKLDRVPQVLFKNFTDCNLIFEQIVSAINGTRPVEEGSKIELLIERKFNSKKAELLAFNKKISHDEIASTAFYVILDGLDPEKYEISLMSNLHVYKRGSATKAERFLFRLAYHSRIFIYFEFKNYGNEYMSVLTENGEFKQIQAKYGDNAKKIEIVDVAYVEEIISILNKA